jgi:hypothetical protein
MTVLDPRKKCNSLNSVRSSAVPRYISSQNPRFFKSPQIESIAKRTESLMFSVWPEFREKTQEAIGWILNVKPVFIQSLVNRTTFMNARKGIPPGMADNDINVVSREMRNHSPSWGFYSFSLPINEQ